MASTSLNHERLQEICGSLREQMFRKGTKGLKKVALVFRQADFNGNKKLDREEFEEALSHCGLFLKSHEISFLFKNFDRDGDGNINYDELLHGIQLPLSPPRLAVVERAFKILDKDGSSVIGVNDIAKIYDASNHPDVQEGKKTEREVLIAFMAAFEKNGTTDGNITFDEFKSYYEDLGSSIPSDAYFVGMMENVWKVKSAAGSGPEAAVDSQISTWMTLLRNKAQQKTKTGKRLSLTLQSIFKFFDGDESGAVTKEEFSKALVQLGVHINDKELNQFFNFFAGADGRISTSEFIKKMDLDD